MRRVEIVPSASALLQSLRGFVYTPQTALADLIDNSIAAGATKIEIVLDWNEGRPIARVLDDGRGMDETRLVQAMRFGGDGPGAERPDSDLGRFGLGLKTASLSQWRRLTVATRKGGETSALAWDVDQVIARHRWDALDPTPLPPSDQLAALLDRPNGTLCFGNRWMRWVDFPAWIATPSSCASAMSALTLERSSIGSSQAMPVESPSLSTIGQSADGIRR